MATICVIHRLSAIWRKQNESIIKMFGISTVAKSYYESTFQNHKKQVSV